MTVKELIKEDDKRHNIMYSGYDPIIGTNAPLDRKWLNIPDFDIPKQYVPVDMFKEDLIKSIVKHKTIKSLIINGLNKEYNKREHRKISRAITKIRATYDFCFWAYMFIKIKPKKGGDTIAFYLHYEQTLLLIELETMRLAGEPIRVVLLKARQWGGSTLVQVYLSWIQLLHKSGWYSTIIAQTKDVSRKIKGMYSKLLEHYPSWLLNIESRQLEFSPFEGSSSDFIVTYSDKGSNIVARDSITTIGTYEKPDSTRGGDSALIHYSEVALWNETIGKKPEDVVKSNSGGLMHTALTVEVLESTANGTGNYFHQEYERAKNGESNRKAVFIPWWKIEHDSIPVKDKEEFARWLIENKDNDNNSVGWLDSGKYYWYLWQLGATFAGINWYRNKRKSYIDHSDMASEAPSDDIEAFVHSGQRVFDVYQINKMRVGTKKPRFIGEVSGKSASGKDCIKNTKFTEELSGCLKIWELPDKELNVKYRYITVVDIGGRSKTSDFSVISTIDRFPMTYGGKPEVVSQWRGHVHHDILAWKAIQIATFYNNSYLVIEANTYETRNTETDTEGSHHQYILTKISKVYKNLYMRAATDPEDIKDGILKKIGYHVNTGNKFMLIDNLIACLRDMLWIEREEECCNELGWYERKQDGKYGAISKQHDDILMTRAIALLICFTEMPMPLVYDGVEGQKYSNVNDVFQQAMD
jgi:hypothetical protein